jgi:hypothetical protein
MARRIIEIEGERWYVYPSGRVTSYTHDELGLVFEKGTGPDLVRRVTRFRSLGASSRDAALVDLSDAQLVEYYRQSQGDRTSPEVRYGRRDR